MIQFIINLFNTLFNKKETAQPEQIKINNINEIDMVSTSVQEVDTMYLFL